MINIVEFAITPKTELDGTHSKTGRQQFDMDEKNHKKIIITEENEQGDEEEEGVGII